MINSKRNVVLGISAGALIALSGWTQVWFVFSASEGVALSDVTVSGTEIRPLVSALAFGSLAAVGALLLAGPRARIFILVATVIIGTSGLVSVFTATASPVGAAISSLSSVLGVVDVSAVTQAVTRTSLTAWIWATAFGFALLTAAAASGVVSSRRWTQPTDRFNRPEIEANSADVRSSQIADGDSWDSLSRGEDPTR